MSKTPSELHAETVSAAVNAYLALGKVSTELENQIKALLYDWPRLEIIKKVKRLTINEIEERLAFIKASHPDFLHGPLKGEYYELMCLLRDARKGRQELLEEDDLLATELGYAQNQSFCVTTPKLLIQIYKRDESEHTQYVIDFMKKELY